MKNLKKKIAGIVMSVCLCASLMGGMTAFAESADLEAEAKVAGHVHVFTVSGKTLYNTRVSETHSYVSGYRYDPTAQEFVPATYGTCYVVEYMYSGLWKCACGATDGTYYYPSEYHHSACGQ